MLVSHCIHCCDSINNINWYQININVYINNLNDEFIPQISVRIGRIDDQKLDYQSVCQSVCYPLICQSVCYNYLSKCLLQ